MSSFVSEVATSVNRQKGMIFSIEGNIGAGKSTFLNTLKKHLDIDFQFFPENLDSWTNVGNKNINLLDLLYTSPERWAFLFNQYVMLTKLEHYDQMVKKLSSEINFTERSLYSDKLKFFFFFNFRKVFMKNFVLNG